MKASLKTQPELRILKQRISVQRVWTLDHSCDMLLKDSWFIEDLVTIAFLHVMGFIAKVIMK